jgi:hypothetical protein
MATERDAAAQRGNIGDDERGQAAEEVGEESATTSPSWPGDWLIMTNQGE